MLGILRAGVPRELAAMSMRTSPYPLHLSVSFKSEVRRLIKRDGSRTNWFVVIAVAERGAPADLAEFDRITN